MVAAMFCSILNKTLQPICIAQQYYVSLSISWV